MEQLENVFRTPAKIDLGCGFGFGFEPFVGVDLSSGEGSAEGMLAREEPMGDSADNINPPPSQHHNQVPDMLNVDFKFGGRPLEINDSP
jgi:hypothetical protein